MGPKEIAIIVLAVIAVLLLIIVIILAKKVKKYERAIAFIYNIIDDDTEAEIYNTANNAANRVAELEKNEVAEYNRLLSQINKDATAKLNEIEKRRQIETSRVCNELNSKKAAANRAGDARTMGQIQLQINNETAAISKTFNIEKDKVHAQQKSLISELKGRFGGALDEYRRLKLIKKDFAVLDKIFKKAKSNENLVD